MEPEGSLPCSISNTKFKKLKNSKIHYVGYWLSPSSVALGIEAIKRGSAYKETATFPQEVSSKTNLPQYVAGQTGYHTDQDG
jgi:hypothetical protein